MRLTKIVKKSIRLQLPGEIGENRFNHFTKTNNEK